MYRVATWLRRVLALGLINLTLPIVAASAQEMPPGPAAATAPAPLAPGEYRWHPEDAPEGGAVDIVVSLPLQRVWVFRGGALVGYSTTSTGRPGHETPTGSFPILQKNEDHYSNLYDNAPMPFMQRLTWDGIALHGGPVRAEPASHGCIRLPDAFARHLFGLTDLGTNVVVTDRAPEAPGEALAIALAAIS